MSLGRTERTSQGMTATLRQQRQYSLGARARVGQPGQDSTRRQSGQYIQDRKQRTRLTEQDSKEDS